MPEVLGQFFDDVQEDGAAVEHLVGAGRVVAAIGGRGGWRRVEIGGGDVVEKGLTLPRRLGRD